MAKKYQRLSELYRRTAAAVVKDGKEWQDFLTSACRNYKCRFDEQLLIYAQRPDAVAVAEIGTWNRLFKRWVNKDSMGIAVFGFDREGRKDSLKYYFDLSDTHEGYYGSRPVLLWRLDRKYEQPVIERLSGSFEAGEGKEIVPILLQAVQNAVDDDLPDYVTQIRRCAGGSRLEEIDDYHLAVTYRKLAADSVGFMVLCRCGLAADRYFGEGEFEDIRRFNTPTSLNAFGAAVSDISEIVLREISQAIREVQTEERKQGRTFADGPDNGYDKGRTGEERNGGDEDNKKSRRSEGDRRDHLQQAGGLPDPRPSAGAGGGASPRPVRADAQGLSGESQEGGLHQPADDGEAGRIPVRSGAGGARASGANRQTAGIGAGSDREDERKGPDPVGADDERHPQPGGGDDNERADLQLESDPQNIIAGEEAVTADIPSIEEQKKMIAEAGEQKSSAFSVSQEDIDDVLVRGNGFEHRKYRIYRQFQKREDKKSNIEFLKKEYGTGGGSYTYPDGLRGMVHYSAKGIAIEKYGSYAEPDLLLKWTEAEKRLRGLVRDGRYLNPEEKGRYVDYLESIAAPADEIKDQKKISRRRFIDAHRDLPPADKRDTLPLRLSDFIRDLDGYEKRLLLEVGRTDLSDAEPGQMEEYLKDPATVQQLLDFLGLVQGRTADAYSRSNAWRFREELRELYPLRYRYQEGDSVYIGADQYEITGLSGDMVTLRNVQFPIFTQEYSRKDFEEKLKENPVNEHLKVIVAEGQGADRFAEEKTDSIRFSIGFSEHPAFYDRELKDRFTDLSFALGNHLLGVLDEKQHKERLDEGRKAGWYKKTEFEISAVIGGEDFHYEGRFDIGDGEGDLIAHIKNFYAYALSPDCPFIPEWKRQGEKHYREQIESLQKGRDVLVPFLMEHAELTQEDKRLFAEIMATESDWFHRTEKSEEQEELEEQEGSQKERLLEEAKEYIDRFCEREYGSAEGADYTDLSGIGLAYTTTEDGQHEIQAAADLIRCRMETYVDGVLVEYTQYDGLADLIENALSALDFGELVYVPEEQLEPFYREGEERSGEEPGQEIGQEQEQTQAQEGKQDQEEKQEQPEDTAGINPLKETIAKYPAVKNGLPYDIIVEKLSFDEPEKNQEQNKRSENKAENEPGNVSSQNKPAEGTPQEKITAHSKERRNFQITSDTPAAGSAREKFRNNIAAIRLLHGLQTAGRLASPEEQEILSKYAGWGGLPMAFDERDRAWAEEYKELKSVLSEEEYQAAMESTLTAFYTPPVVIKAMYEVLGRLGFSRGNILEPSCGVGSFFGLLPEGMAGSKLHGIEIDPVSGGIAKQLYQKADIAVEGFEDTALPDGYFDAVIGNVPFGDFKINDSRYNAHKFLIHDYFFAKALDKVRAGGVVMFLTSKGTMDKGNPAVRRYIARRAELLGAVRLPDDTFKANAGTEVTSDILILQKRDRIIDAEPDWVYLGTDEDGITMNRYFIGHPEMVLGEMKLESARFGMDTVCKARPDMPLPELLKGAAERISGEIQIPEPDDGIDRISDPDGQEGSIEADPEVRNFSFTLVDGRVYFRENNRMTPAKVSLTAENRIKGLVEIRDCVRRLIKYQTDDFPEEKIQAGQEELNSLYDAFTARYGLINSRGNYLAFAADESYFLLCSLEVLDDEGRFKRKADMFTRRTIRPHREVTSVGTSAEALAVSIGEKARVDLGYMARLSGKTQGETVKELQGVIFKVPFSEPARYVAADEYLSGNVREKLKIARTAAKADPEFAVNAAALEKVIPEDLAAGEISVRLGTAWIPQEDIQQFMVELLKPSAYAAGRIKVRYTPVNGEWFIENKGADFGNVRADSTYGTKRASAYRIIEDTLNLRDTRIFDYVYDEQGNKKAVFNAKETMAAQAKQEAVKQAFKDWIWEDAGRRNRLVRYYNDTFNSIRPREYDGSHITFGGISPEIKLRPHQVNAIAHILYGGNTLLAHKVGAGKTFEMVAAAQESKRLGLCQKSMFVVPNHLVGQWASEYLRLYPSADILVARKQDFETANRKKFCGRIATGSYDAVIIGHSQFEKIPISEDRQRDQLMRQLHDIEYGIKNAQGSQGEQFSVKQLMKTRKAIKAKLDKLNGTKRKDNVINFEELGVDRLFIDESHFYKNLYLYTKMRNIGGIAQTEAQKSSDLFMKCRYLDEITGGRGIVFATGTPVSNSMAELYSVQRYLQYDTLAGNGLQHFDSWASTFGETVTALELAPEGTNYRAKTRFAKFYNLPELMQMFKEVADIQTAEMLNLPVPKVCYHNIKTKPSRIQTELVAGLAKRAEKIRERLVEPAQDNMLKVTNDGRKLALDQRLADPMLPDDPDSKVNVCAGNIFRIWEEHADTKAAQLCFCDISTPKNDGSFNVYDDMREKLVRRGIPAEQIRFIHESKTDAQKKELFAKVRSGEVRVLFGSTQKMGAGTNCQDRLIAIHNLDCPWRPSDVGRILRTFKIKKNVEVTDNGKIII